MHVQLERGRLLGNRPVRGEVPSRRRKLRGRVSRLRPQAGDCGRAQDIAPRRLRRAVPLQAGVPRRWPTSRHPNLVKLVRAPLRSAIVVLHDGAGRGREFLDHVRGVRAQCKAVAGARSRRYRISDAEPCLPPVGDRKRGGAASCSAGLTQVERSRRAADSMSGSRPRFGSSPKACTRCTRPGSCTATSSRRTCS